MVSAGFVVYRGWDLQVFIASSFFAVVCFIDTLRSKIPNIVNASLAVAGLAFNFSSAGSQGLFLSLSGMLAGLALLLIPYLMGGFGAGDVKALAALGSLVGPWPIAQIFIYMALFGGMLAVIHSISNRNLLRKLSQWCLSLRVAALTGDPGSLKSHKPGVLRFPYATAIALGYYVWLIRGDAL